MRVQLGILAEDNQCASAGGAADPPDYERCRVSGLQRVRHNRLQKLYRSSLLQSPFDVSLLLYNQPDSSRDAVASPEGRTACAEVPAGVDDDHVVFGKRHWTLATEA